MVVLQDRGQGQVVIPPAATLSTLPYSRLHAQTSPALAISSTSSGTRRSLWAASATQVSPGQIARSSSAATAWTRSSSRVPTRTSSHPNARIRPTIGFTPQHLDQLTLARRITPPPPLSLPSPPSQVLTRARDRGRRPLPERAALREGLRRNHSQGLRRILERRRIA